MLKLGRVTKVKMLFLVLVFVFNFDLFKFSAAILEKGLLFTQSTFGLFMKPKYKCYGYFHGMEISSATVRQKKKFVFF